MTIITSRVVEDSTTSEGARIMTLLCKYPRALHAELMTHRKFSRNASSSRAIPVEKLADMSFREMWEPLQWGLNQRGMQAQAACLEGDDLAEAQEIWREMARVCTAGVKRLGQLGLHKQWANRPLEWFGHISVVITSTDWDNWDELRDHKDAFPEIRNLCVVMRDARAESTPVVRTRNRMQASSWHLPFVSQQEREVYENQPDLLAKVSAARCARTSYLTHEGAEPNISNDLELFQRLVGQRPLHASPTEHQAYPLPLGRQVSRNFDGWRQHRELVEHLFWK